jgi:hypothetical protein
MKILGLIVHTFLLLLKLKNGFLSKYKVEK